VCFSVNYPKCKECSSYYFVTCALSDATVFLRIISCTALFSGRKVIEHKVCIDFPYNLPETFLMLRIIDRGMIKMSFGLHVKCPLILSDFNET